MRKMPEGPQDIAIKTWAEMFEFLRPRDERTPPATDDASPPGGSDAKPRPARAADLPCGLTPAEMAIVEILAEGVSNREIARRRNCAVGTVKVHLGRIFCKLNVTSRGEVIVRARHLVALWKARAEEIRTDAFQPDWIRREMTPQTLERETVLFRRGDPADALYYLQEGEVHLPEAGAVLKAGAVLGEIGVFSPSGLRTATAVCRTPVRLWKLTADQSRELSYRNPSFAAHVLSLAASRLEEERSRRIGEGTRASSAESPDLVMS